MATNISKYVQLNDFLLLEYEFNKEGLTTSTPVLNNAFVVDTCVGSKYFYEGAGAVSNNTLTLNAIPLNVERTSWYFDANTPTATYPAYWDASVSLPGIQYMRDTVKLHIVSGYNFEDIGGFLLQIRGDSSTNGMVDLANFIYAKQTSARNSNVIKFAINTLFLGNRFYDKYVEFQVPSLSSNINVNGGLGGDITSTLGSELKINKLSDVYIQFSNITDIINGAFILNEQINVQLPVSSAADNFNCFIAESTSGDYIEYYAVWDKFIIGEYIGDIESGKIKLYTSNNPNDSAGDFTTMYGSDTRKWVIIHEISVYEHIPGGTSLLSQKYSFTQENGFSTPNYFRPILPNSDLDSSYSIQYTCRLVNRMDGTQIIRKAAFSSTNPKKYGNWLSKLNVDNLLPYSVFNKIESEKTNTNIQSGLDKIKYIKVFYDTVKVVLNYANEVYPQGTGPLFLKSYDSVYKFKFEKIDDKSNRINVDLSGAFNYALMFKLDNNSKIEVGPTYSTNMNTTIGEIEFKLTEDQLSILAKQTGNSYSIVVKNPNGSEYTFYEGSYYPMANEAAIISNYKSMFTVTDLQKTIADLESKVNKLNEENLALKSNF